MTRMLEALHVFCSQSLNRSKNYVAFNDSVFFKEASKGKAHPCLTIMLDVAEPVCCNCSDRLRPSTNPPLSCRWLRGFPYSVQFFSFKSPHPLCTLVHPYVAEPVYYCSSYPARPGTAPTCLPGSTRYCLCSLHTHLRCVHGTQEC